MTIIELFKKIANGKSVPYRVEILGTIFTFNEDEECYIADNEEHITDILCASTEELNEEIVVLQESEDKFEKLPDTATNEEMIQKVNLMIVEIKKLQNDIEDLRNYKF